MGTFFEMKYYGDTQPHAIIFWYKGEDRLYKTWCFDEQDVNRALTRHNTAGDFYSKFRPSVHYLNEKGMTNETNYRNNPKYPHCEI